MDRLFTLTVNIFKPLSKLVVIIAGYALVILSFMITYDVISRKLFNTSSIGTDEIGGYIVAIMAAFGFTYALFQHAHTRIDILFRLLSKRIRAVLNILALIGIAIYATFMAWRAFDTLLESIQFSSRANTPLRTPQWIPQSIWLFGLVIFAIATIVLLIHSIWLLMKGATQENFELYGPKGVQDEIEEEIIEIESLDGPSTVVRHMESTSD